MSQMHNFAIIVSEDIKNSASQHDRDFIRLPENLSMWKDCLLEIISTVSDKINELERDIKSLRSSYPDFVTDPAAGMEDQKSKSERFRFYAEKRLAEVERLTALGQPADPSLSLATFLRDAILAHKQLIESNDLSTSAADDCLYAALDGVWKF